MKSLRQAINEKCKECLYSPGDGGGNWRQQITACTAPKCPLFDVRPVSKPKTQGAGKMPVALAKWRDSQAEQEQSA